NPRQGTGPPPRERADRAQNMALHKEFSDKSPHSGSPNTEHPAQLRPTRNSSWGGDPHGQNTAGGTSGVAPTSKVDRDEGHLSPTRGRKAPFILRAVGADLTARRRPPPLRVTPSRKSWSDQGGDSPQRGGADPAPGGEDPRRSPHYPSASSGTGTNTLPSRYQAGTDTSVARGATSVAVSGTQR